MRLCDAIRCAFGCKIMENACLHVSILLRLLHSEKFISLIVEDVSLQLFLLNGVSPLQDSEQIDLTSAPSFLLVAGVASQITETGTFQICCFLPMVLACGTWQQVKCRAESGQVLILQKSYHSEERLHLHLAQMSLWLLSTRHVLASECIRDLNLPRR